MGNSSSTEEPVEETTAATTGGGGTAAAEEEQAATTTDMINNNDWPSNLHVETRDMMAVSFLVYSFAYILAAARKQGGLKGLEVETSSTTTATSDQQFAAGQIHKPRSSSSTDDNHNNLGRSFTPAEVIELIEQNLESLAKAFPSEFKDPTKVLESLKLLQKRVEDAAPDGGFGNRPLCLDEFDDKHQKHELVYAVTKDDINKRITLVFRGTDNELAFSDNWSTNMSVWKKTVEMPDYLKDKDLVTSTPLWWTKPTNVRIHGGYHKYLFETTFDDTDDKDLRKYDEIVTDVLRLLQDHTDYKLYVTGHSLGGGLSHLVSFFMATDDRFPKPITCISAAAPRVGDWNYLWATQVLEQNQQLRSVRIVNENDLVPCVPFVGYHHAGFQVRLFTGQAPPQVTYPKLQDGWSSRFGRSWKNSIMANLNIRYDHGDYRDRVDLYQESLAKLDLNALYRREDLTGWKLL